MQVLLALSSFPALFSLPAFFRFVQDDVLSRRVQSLTPVTSLGRVEIEAAAGAETYGRRRRKKTTRMRIAQTVRFHVTGTASNSANAGMMPSGAIVKCSAISPAPMPANPNNPFVITA